jgi:hypothetical protein
MQGAGEGSLDAEGENLKAKRKYLLNCSPELTSVHMFCSILKINSILCKIVHGLV